jgi:hypothetical protein
MEERSWWETGIAERISEVFRLINATTVLQVKGRQSEKIAA